MRGKGHVLSCQQHAHLAGHATAVAAARVMRMCSPTWRLLRVVRVGSQVHARQRRCAGGLQVCASTARSRSAGWQGSRPASCCSVELA